MPVKLYKMDPSPPCAAAMMICGIHNAPVEMIDVDLREKEHLKPEYVKKNPMKTVPTLEDDDLVLHDSHTIITYLTDKYGKDDSLYPKDTKKRALVDQKLIFDVIFFARVRNITYPAVIEGVRNPPEKFLNDLRQGYDILETFLNNTKFVASDNMTIADVSLVATVAATSYIVPIDAAKYPKIQAWFSFMESQPFYQKYAAPGSAALKKLLGERLDL